ncbi:MULTISPECIES: FDLD family class I lanthipeptide [Bacillus]|nr:FDLD family class I lanthipeptide [Bacillus subtilis]
MEMEKNNIFDLDINKKMESTSEVSAQTWATIGKTIVQSVKKCRTFTCGCSLGSCSNCN